MSAGRISRSSTPRSTRRGSIRWELYFSVVQRKVLDPNQWTSPADLEAALLAFGERYSAIARPFEWRFTRDDLRRVLAALPVQTAAA